MLIGYLSRSQVRDYLGHILEYGVNGIVESPDSVDATEPVPVRIGSSVNSVKVFHVARGLDKKNWLTQLGVELSSNDEKPELPDGTSIVGVFYMSKLGRDYKADADQLDGDNIKGDIGDVVWFSADAWDSAALSRTSDGINHRLFVFWKSDIITDPVDEI